MEFDSTFDLQDEVASQQLISLREETENLRMSLDSAKRLLEDAEVARARSDIERSKVQSKNESLLLQLSDLRGQFDRELRSTKEKLAEETSQKLQLVKSSCATLIRVSEDCHSTALEARARALSQIEKLGASHSAEIEPLIFERNRLRNNLAFLESRHIALNETAISLQAQLISRTTEAEIAQWWSFEAKKWWEERVSEIRKEVNNFRKSTGCVIEDTRTHIHALISERNHLKSEVAVLSQEVEELSLAMTRRSVLCSKYSNQCVSLENDLRSANERAETLEKELKIARKREKETSSELRNWRESATLSTSKCSQLQQRLKETQEASRETAIQSENKWALCQVEKDSALADLARLSDKFDSLRRSLAELHGVDEELTRAREEVSAVRRERDRTVTEKDELRSELQDVSNRLHSSLSELHDLSREISSLKFQLQTEKEGAAGLKSENVTLRERVREAEYGLTRAADENSDLRTTVESLRRKDGEYQSLLAEIPNWKRKVDTLERRCADAESERASARKDFECLSEAHGSLTEELHSGESARFKLSAANADLSRLSESQLKEIERLKERVRAEEDISNGLRDSLSLLQLRVTQTEERSGEREREQQRELDRYASSLAKQSAVVAAMEEKIQILEERIRELIVWGDQWKETADERQTLWEGAQREIEGWREECGRREQARVDAISKSKNIQMEAMHLEAVIARVSRDSETKEFLLHSEFIERETCLNNIVHTLSHLHSSLPPSLSPASPSPLPPTTPDEISVVFAESVRAVVENGRALDLLQTKENYSPTKLDEDISLLFQAQKAVTSRVVHLCEISRAREPWWSWQQLWDCLAAKNIPDDSPPKFISNFKDRNIIL